MTEWKYGGAGDVYPVRPGQLWTVGKHRLRCADLEKLTGPAFAERPDVVYVDPPWNAGNAKSFRTKAGLQDGKVDFFGSFIPAVVRQIKPCKGSVFCESGRREEKKVVETMQKYGAKLLGRWDIMYYRKHPCVLLRFSFSGLDDGFRMDLTDIDDEDTPREILGSYAPGKLVLDCCLGRGLTPVAAATAKHIFMGTELHPRRMAVALEKLAKVTRIEPKLVA